MIATEYPRARRSNPTERFHRKLGGALAALALALGSSAARAQSPGETGTVAEALFRDGVGLFEKGRIHDACEKFAESFRIDPANGTLQNLALCHEREGKIASAWAEFAQLAGRAAQAEQREREQMARARTVALEARVSRVRLVFAAGSNVERVAVDGQELGRAAWSSPLPLDPGAHAFVFAAPGMKSATRPMRVDVEGQVLRLDVPRLEAEPVVVPRRVAAKDDGTPGRRIAGLVIGGGGVLAIGVGAYFGFATLSAKSEGDARCHGRLCDAAGLALQDRAHTDATISTIAFGAGLVAASVSAYLLLTSGDASVVAGTSPATDRARLRIAPDAFARGAGLSARMSW